MDQRVNLVGLDIGTTTTSAMFASTRLQRTATGRIELDELCETTATTIFTPFCEAQLDLNALLAWLDNQFGAAAIDPATVFGGGALITGLAAQSGNSRQLTELIHTLLRDAVIATAADPRLEAWLAFMAAAGPISRELGERAVINLDIGGGTTNVAIGRAGQVFATGSIFVGARHVQVMQGTYRIKHVSNYAMRIFEGLKIARRPGEELRSDELQSLLEFYVECLECFTMGQRFAKHGELACGLAQADVAASVDAQDAVITFSGGVGELLYQLARGKQNWGEPTPFGDLGVDLARAILNSPVLSKDVRSHVPGHTGRATVFGLLRHATQVSGSTIHLSDAAQLPLRDIPILGRIGLVTTPAELASLACLAARSPVGGCFTLPDGAMEPAQLKLLAERIACALEAANFPRDNPLVLVTAGNIGKSFGGYITKWGSRLQNITVLDELAPRDAQFVRVGRMHDHLVPVSFYRMN